MISKILIIARRDYAATVMTRTFILGMVLTPLLFSCGLFGIRISNFTKHPARRIAIIDHTGQVAGAIISVAQESTNTTSAGARPNLLGTSIYSFESIQPIGDHLSELRAALSNRVRRGDLFAFIEIGDHVLNRSINEGNPAVNSNQILYYVGDEPLDARVLLTDTINRGIRRVHLTELGINQRNFAQLGQVIPLKRMGLSSRDGDTGKIKEPVARNDVDSFVAPFIPMALIMMVVLVGATPVLSMVAEDKIQRVFEMLLVSATPFELMAGKIVAAVGSCLTSTVFYLAACFLGLHSLAMTEFISVLLPKELLPWFLIYLISEVTAITALGIGLGAACSTPRDAQNLTKVMMAPVITPLLLILPLIQQPQGRFATIISLLPPFTPLVMIARQGMPNGVPTWQVGTGLIGIAVWVALITWVASRIFRIAILLPSMPPRLGQVFRWSVRG
jgi:ABC-2 type transport system permease protein